MSDQSASDVVRPPWFADKPVLVLTYRVNRRPLSQGNLFAEQPDSFIDHLAECLLFGFEVTTSGRGHERRWKLGNREIDLALGYIAGWIGYRAEDAEEQDDYDDDTSAWRTTVVATERRATAPFVVVASTRYLYCAKHSSFSEGTPSVVFESLLNEGERQRGNATTIWSVEPVLDTTEFERWLRDTAIVDRVVFRVKLPNPDAAESFEQIDRHMRAMEAAELTHTLTPRDPDRGLAKDFDAEPIGQGLMEMTRRSYASVRAMGRSLAGTIRSYDQKRHARREHVDMPSTHDGAKDAVVRHGLQRSQEQNDG